MTDDLPGFLDSLASQQAASAAASSAAEVQSLEALLAPGTEPRVGASAQLFPSGSSQAVYGPADISALDATSGASASTVGASGFGPDWRRFIQTGVYNGDFNQPPPDTASAINNDSNALPFWQVVQLGGNAITVKAIADSAAASGYVLDFNMGSGFVNDETVLEQWLPVQGNRARSWAFGVLVTCLTTVDYVTNKILLSGSAAFYKKDRTTLVSGSNAFLAAPGVNTTFINLFGPYLVPSDAYWVRLRVGAKRDPGAATSATMHIRLTDIAYLGAPPFTGLPPTNNIGANTDSGYIQGTSAMGVRLVAYDGANLNWDAGNVLSASGRINSPDLIWGQDGIATNQNAGAVSDASFANTPVNGTIAHDITNHRQYYRRGGAWHYSAETAGFQIPEHETFCPVCREPLLPDDDLIGKGDRVMADGALHALYIHLRCAGKPLDRAVADAYWTVADTDHENPDHDKALGRARGLISRLRRRRP